MRMNKRFVLGALAAVAVVAAGLFGVHTFQYGRIASATLYQADAARDKGDPDAEARYLSRYLELKPEDAGVLERLATIRSKKILNQREATSLLFLYERLLRSDPSRVDARKQAVDVCLRLGRYSDALTHLDSVTRARPDDADAWHKTGYALIASGKHDEARDALRKAVAADPAHVKSYDLLVFVLRKPLDRPREADEVCREMVAKNPNSAEALLTKVRHERAANPQADVAAALAKARELAPDNVEALLVSAEVAQNRGDADQARGFFKTVVEKHPDDIRGWRSLAWLELWVGDRAAGKKVLEDGLARKANEVELLVPYAELLAEDGELKRVEEIRDSVKGRDGSTGAADYLTARLSIARQNWGEAIDQLRKLRAESLARPALVTQIDMLLADCYARVGDRETAADAVQRVIGNDPNAGAARVRLAGLHAKAGRYDDAVREYRLLLRGTYPPNEARLGLATLLLARRKAGESDATLDEVETLVRGLAGEKRFETDVRLIRAEVEALRGRTDKAGELLAEGVRQDSAEPRYWLQRIDLKEQTEGTRAGLRAAREARKTCDCVEVRLREAKLAARVENDRDAVPVSPAEGADRFPAKERVRLFVGLAEMYTRTNRTDAAKHFYRQAVAIEPNSLEAWRGLCELAINDGDDRTVAEALDRLPACDSPDRRNTELLSCRRQLSKAAFEVKMGHKPDLGAAKAAVEDGLRKFPNSHAAHQNAARLAELEGDARTAATQFKQALALDGRDAYSFKRLVRVYADLKDQIALEQAVLRAANSAVLPSDAVRAAVDGVAAQLPDRAFAKLGKAMSGDLPGALWYAAGLARRGKPAEALEQTRRLAAAAPKCPDVWVTHVRVLAAAGDRAAAEEAADKARSAIPAEVRATAMAEIYESLQRHDKVLEANGAALREKPDDLNALRTHLKALMSLNRRPEAIRFLRDVADNAPASSPAQMWGRRNLALVVVRDRTRLACQTAVELLDQNLAADAKSADDLRTKATVLAELVPLEAGPKRADALAAALRSLEEVERQGRLTPGDNFNLARLYATAGKWDESEARLKRLIAASPEQPAFLSYYLSQLTARGGVKRAEPVVVKVRAAGVRDAAVARLVARYYYLAGVPGEALVALDDFAKTVKADAPAKVVELAGLYEEFARAAAARLGGSGVNGFAKRAVALIESHPAAFPDATVRKAVLLGLDGETDKAFAALHATKGVKPRQLAVAGTGLLTVNSPPAHFAAVDGWFAAAVKEGPRTFDLMVTRAEFFNLKRDFDKAEAVYREVLKADANNVVALNNLSWALAQRGERLDEAEQQIEKAIQLTGATGELLDTRASVRIARRDFDAAIADLERSLSDAPTPGRYFRLALAYSRKADAPAAADAFEKAKQLGLNERSLHPLEVRDYDALRKQLN